MWNSEHGIWFNMVNTDCFFFLLLNVWIIMSNGVGVHLILLSLEGARTTDETNCLCNYAGRGCNVSLCGAKKLKKQNKTITIHHSAQTNNQTNLRRSCK